jgi:hypothetical protein
MTAQAGPAAPIALVNNIEVIYDRYWSCAAFRTGAERAHRGAAGRTAPARRLTLKAISNLSAAEAT